MKSANFWCFILCGAFAILNGAIEIVTHNEDRGEIWIAMTVGAAIGCAFVSGLNLSIYVMTKRDSNER